MYYYLTFSILSLIFVMNYSILCLPTKVEKCVADYLLVNKDVKTKIFAEKIGEEWIVKRGVTTGELFTDFLIDKEVMLKSMNKSYRKICSKVLNKYLSEKYNEKYNEGYFNKIKNYIYWWNEIDENTLNIRELFTENKKDYLIVSEKYQKKLGKRRFMKYFLFNKG
ncbi:unnamed protein product [Meloidogyne enterolobii]|uniref:Uncharacterized protein n=1 Tax=Meloidogyne enterolobii TaxID=390850 RepID=A0ACB0Z1B0_MELEN